MLALKILGIVSVGPLDLIGYLREMMNPATKCLIHLGNKPS